mmetsp:Transcript_15989/g.37906  ORF Transcript_15989/g.37906 Transcript_15989/m.37906 type:complete len:218 (+) Transcript_15989:900-1553(+)
MNPAPMALRFASGSVSPLSLESILSESSITVTGRWRCSLKVFITRSDSLNLRRPLSTNTQCSLSPITLCTSVAATAESTPPDSAHITCSSGPTCLATLAICFSITSSMDHVALTLATSKRKCLSVSLPRSVWVTSGWYCSPKMRFSVFSMATIAPCWLLPTASNPGGRTVHSSPWLIQTSCLLWPEFANSSLPSSVSIGIRPYSPPASAASTFPPRL